MSTMALQVMALMWQHPVFSCLIVLLFTPPFFPIVRFFSPLLISTALFMLALFTMGPQTDSQQPLEQQENWEFRRAADVKVWEDKTVGGAERKRRLSGGDGTWMDWLSAAQEASLAWIDAKLRNENWKGSTLNDDNVSILQEASWPKRDPSTPEEAADPALAMDTSLTRLTISAVVEEPAAQLLPAIKPSSTVHHEPLAKLSISEVVEEPVQPLPAIKSSSSVHHEPLVSLQIPKRGATATMIDESPSTDLDELSTEFKRTTARLVNVSESDIDTPVAPVVTLSKSGKLQQIETLVEDKEHAEKSGQEIAVLKPTTADKVDDVKDKLDNFTHNSGEIKPVNTSSSNPRASGSPLFKSGKKSSSAFSDDDSSGDEVMLSDSESDCDVMSDFEIFPPVDPSKMKLHPPVKLDIKQLEIKLGTSLTPPKGEITEVHQ